MRGVWQKNLGMCRLLIRSIDQSDVKLVLGIDPKPFPMGKSLLIFLRQQLILLKCPQMRFNALIKQNIGFIKKHWKQFKKRKWLRNRASLKLISIETERVSTSDLPKFAPRLSEKQLFRLWSLNKRKSHAENWA